MDEREDLRRKLRPQPVDNHTGVFGPYRGPGTPEPAAHGFQLQPGTGNRCRWCGAVPGAAWHDPGLREGDWKRCARCKGEYRLDGVGLCHTHGLCGACHTPEGQPLP